MTHLLRTAYVRLRLPCPERSRRIGFARASHQDLFDQPVKIVFFNTLSLRFTSNKLPFIAGWSLSDSHV